MAINEYEEEGKSLFKVTVTRRSTNDPTIRVQKARDGIKSRGEAVRLEKKLIEVAIREIQERESRCSSWGVLLGQWELALREGKGTRKPIFGTTIHDYVRVLMHYTESWMRLPLDQISRGDVRDVITRMDEEGLSRSRKRTLLMAVNGLFRWAEIEGLLKAGIRSPASGMELSKEEEKVPLILSLNEVKKLLQQARDRGHEWYPIWEVALLTGARSGELIALQWENVDFERGQILINKSYNARMKSTKSTKAGYWRTVPMNADLIGRMRELRASAPNRVEVFPQLSMWKRGEAAKVLRAFCEEIGIPPVTFHTLRACFATHLLTHGTPHTVVMRICGWRDLKTMQRYIRLAGIDTKGATDVLKIVPLQEAMPKVIDIFAHQG